MPELQGAVAERALTIVHDATATAAAAKLPEKSSAIVESARALAIVDDASYERAGEFLLGVAALEKEITDHHAPIKSAAHKAHKAVCDAEAALLKGPRQAREIVEPRVLAYQKEQERKREEERRRLEAEERARLEEEHLAEAVSIEEVDGTEAASAFLDEERAPVTVVLPLAPAAPKVAGVATRAVWKWRITDENRVPRQFLKVDEQAINAIVRAQKDRTRIPGVEVYQETALAVSRR